MLYCPGNYIQYPVINPNGEEYKKRMSIYVCVSVYLNHFAQQKLIQRWKSATIKEEGDFPAYPVVKTLCFHCRGHGFEPWWGTRSYMPSTAKGKKKKKRIAQTQALKGSDDNI